MSSPLIRYAVVPGVGRVRWHAYDAFKDLVLELESKGEFKRLGRMVQLGVLAHGLESAHQTRREYASLFMYLCDLIGVRGGQARLATNVTVGDETVTKGELVKAWFLLLQFGHFGDTYASERLLLYWLRKNDHLLSTFKKRIATEAHSSLDHVVESGNWYGLAPFFAMARLGVVPLEEKTRKFAHAALGLFVDARTRSPIDKIYDAYAVYSVLREIAFLHLDLQFTARSVVVDPVALALQIHEEASLVDRLRTRTDPRGQVLESVAAYLCETAYLTPRNAEFVYERLSTLKKKHQVRLSSNQEDDHIAVLKALWEPPDTAPDDVTARHAFSLPVPLSPKGDLETYEVFRKAVGKRYRVYAARWPVAARHTEVYFLVSKKVGEPQEQVSVRKVLNALKAAANLWLETDGEDQVLWQTIDERAPDFPRTYARMIGATAQHLLAVALELPDLEIRSVLAEQHRAVTVPWTPCKGVREAGAVAALHLPKMEGKHPGTSLCHEAEALKDVLKEHGKKGGYYLIGQ